MLLERIVPGFDVHAPGIDEAARPGELPADLARRLAREKAMDVAAGFPDRLVIGSDQVASLDGRDVIGKPGNHERAREQLRAASGRTMLFHTALACIRRADDFRDEAVVTTQVRFRRLTGSEIENYLHLEEPWDVAGSARAEGLGIALLEAIEGDDPTALIGLPLIALSAMLSRAGLSPLARLSPLAARRAP